MTINSLTGGLLLRWGERGGENIEVAGSRWIPHGPRGAAPSLKQKLKTKHPQQAASYTKRTDATHSIQFMKHATNCLAHHLSRIFP